MAISSFSSLIAAADTLLLSCLGEISLTIHYQDNSPAVVVSAITRNPALEEDYVPGSPTTQGVTNLILFIRFSPLLVPPRKGDTGTVNGIDYDIWQVAVDREGGATLRMRRCREHYDQ